MKRIIMTENKNENGVKKKSLQNNYKPLGSNFYNDSTQKSDTNISPKNSAA